MNSMLKYVVCLIAIGATGCASSSENSYSRSGRGSGVSKPMNSRSLTVESLYQACIRERPEVSCRNRLGR